MKKTSLQSYRKEEQKEKAVIDTNVYISSIFWKGNPNKVIELALKKEILAFTSSEILNELRNVLINDFKEPEDIAERQIKLILGYAEVVEGSAVINAIKEDPDDNKILECAEASKADFIITGDKHLLKFGKYGRTSIVNAKQFLNRRIKE